MSKNQSPQNESQSEVVAAAAAAATSSCNTKCRNCHTNKSSIQPLLATNSLNLNPGAITTVSSSTPNQDEAVSTAVVLLQNTNANNSTNETVVNNENPVVTSSTCSCSANNCNVNCCGCAANASTSSTNPSQPQPATVAATISDLYNSFSQAESFNLTQLGSILAKNKANLYNLNQSDLEQLANLTTNLNRKSCIIERLGGLYMNESLADVQFLVGGKSAGVGSTEQFYNETAEKLPAHKLVLSIGSPVFMAMFYGSGVHMHANTGLIEIPDVEPDSFKNMLRYLYTDELHIGPDSVMGTLYAAKKYAVSQLERECVDFLTSQLRPDNAFMLLEQARLFDEPQLADLCLALIDKSACEALASDHFLDVGLDTLVQIIRRDTLGIREFKLFNFLLKWAQAQCARSQPSVSASRENVQRMLGEAVKHIRFTLMTKEEFALVMNDPDARVLSDEAIVDVFVHLTLSDGGNSNSCLSGESCVMSNNLRNSMVSLKKLGYNEKSRCCLGGKEQVISRFCHVESRWGYSGTSDRVRFSVSRRVYVVGFGLYGSIYGRCEYQALIQLIHYDSCATCSQNSVAFVCDGTNSTFKVMFKDPVEIQPDTDYIAAATLKGPDSYYGTKGMRKVNHENGQGGKVTFNFQYASGNNNGSSVEDGQIPEIIFLYSCS